MFEWAGRLTNMCKTVLKTVVKTGRRPASCRRAPWSAAVCAGALFAAGCSSPPAFQFDKLDISVTRDSLSEFSLGKYKIPIPIANDRTDDHGKWSNRLEFDFELFALVAPAEASRLADSWERHEGKIRDRVIQVCRNASLDELQEPELSTLKSRL